MYDDSFLPVQQNQVRILPQQQPQPQQAYDSSSGFPQQTSGKVATIQAEQQNLVKSYPVQKDYWRCICYGINISGDTHAVSNDQVKFEINWGKNIY